MQNHAILTCLRHLKLGTCAAAGLISACGADQVAPLNPSPEVITTSTTGGDMLTGGALATGGGLTTGGVLATGGDLTTGGVLATGGGLTTGGAVVSGGEMLTGGDLTTGGDIEPESGHIPSCIDDEADVVMIGDSYVDWITHTFVADLRAESGQNWPSYAIGGTSMASGGIGFIPDQLDTAFSANANIQVIVMSGGGNDILVADTAMFPDAAQCTRTDDSPNIADCQAIVEKAVDRAKELMVETADKGVRDIIYFFYPHIPGGGLISGPSPNAILDYALPRAREACETALERTSGRLNCHFVDMVPVFDGKDGLFADWASEAGDGVHPNAMGSKAMAKEIWRVMKEACLAEPSGSECCIPAPN